MRCELSLALWILSSAGSVAGPAITVAALQAQLNHTNQPTVIDIRSPEQFALGHIPGAINVPASLCPFKRLPPLGKVVVCDSGLGRDATDSAVIALAAKPGLSVQVLDGGFAAWQSANAPDTRAKGFKPATLNYLSYADLKGAAPDQAVLVDLRRRPTPGKQAAAADPTQSLTDLAVEFPRLRTAALDAPKKQGGGSSAPPLMVLIDNGDGTAEAMARRLKAGGNYRYAILAGGELTLARHGQAGLQRAGSKPGLQPAQTVPAGAKP